MDGVARARLKLVLVLLLVLMLKFRVWESLQCMIVVLRVLGFSAVVNGISYKNKVGARTDVGFYAVAEKCKYE